MKAQPNREKDKQYLYNLCKILKISKNNVSLDDCGDWNLYGLRKENHIFTDTTAWYFYYSAKSVRDWESKKRRLSFMVVTQDGDDEGILKLVRMPTEEEAKIVKKLLKLKISKDLSEEERATLKNRLNSACTRGVSDEIIALNV